MMYLKVRVTEHLQFRCGKTLPFRTASLLQSLIQMIGSDFLECKCYTDERNGLFNLGKFNLY